MGDEREEKALRDFKKVVKHLLKLFKEAAGVETIYMYWVNRSRSQFVLEARSTDYKSVGFSDRIEFSRHFLDRYKNVNHPITLEIGEKKEIGYEDLNHYLDDIPVTQLLLLPIVNKDETVALTVLESEQSIELDRIENIVTSFEESLRNVLSTYTQITKLLRDEEEWESYEESLADLNEYEDLMDIIEHYSVSMAGYLSQGGVSVVVQAGDHWVTLFNAPGTTHRLPVGLPLEKSSITDEVIRKKESMYLAHFNSSPRRVNSREPDLPGATLAVPLKIEGKVRAVVLAYDENPLIFKESLKHKLINMVRLASLKIGMLSTPGETKNPFVTPEFDVLSPEVWKRIVKMESRLQGVGQNFWVGHLSFDNLQNLRTRLRLDALKSVIRKFLQQADPIAMGLSGIIGSIGEYKYVVILTGNNGELPEYYKKILQKNLNDPIVLYEADESSVNVEPVCQFVKIVEQTKDPDLLLKELEK